MEKRILLAVLLMAAVLWATNLFFPPPPPQEAEVAEVVPAPTPQPVLPRVAEAPTAMAPADTAVVLSPLYRYAFSTRGAALVGASLLQYESYTTEGPVELVPEGARALVSHRLAIGGDTLDLATLPFQVDRRELRLAEGGAAERLRFSYQGEGAFGVEIAYTFTADHYLIGMEGAVRGVSGATLLTEIGPGLAPNEAYGHRSDQSLEAVSFGDEDGVEITGLRDLSGRGALPGTFEWAGIKDKFFLAVALSGTGRPFSTVLLEDLPDVPFRFVEEDEVVEQPRGRVITALPIGADGRFALSAYVGPQDYQRLAAMDRELEDVIPFGYRWLQPVVRPFAALIMLVLAFLHDNLGIQYGWVLVIFGVLMRVLLWPLNAKALRSQAKNAELQPLIQEIKEQHKGDPQKQNEEIMKVMRERGFNPLAGCLPMLIPMPVLITLFFLFQSTIAFRGVEFLWLPDLSLADPYYILPVFLVISMFGLQWISMKISGADQNPQMKMMMYFMPVVFGILFFTLPAGLNLYYATTNVATIPQQVLIARERKKIKEAQDAAKPAPPPTRAGKRKREKKR